MIFSSDLRHLTEIGLVFYPMQLGLSLNYNIIEAGGRGKGGP